LHADSLMAYLRRSFEYAAEVVCRKTAKKTKPGLICERGALPGCPWWWLFLSVPPQGWCRSDSRRTSSSVLSAPSIWRCLPSCAVERFRSTSAQLTASRAQFAGGVPRSCVLGAHRPRHRQRIDGIRLPPFTRRYPGSHHQMRRAAHNSPQAGVKSIPRWVGVSGIPGAGLQCPSGRLWASRAAVGPAFRATGWHRPRRPRSHHDRTIVEPARYRSRAPQ
jgi:hypothetical protein